MSDFTILFFFLLFLSSESMSDYNHLFHSHWLIPEYKFTLFPQSFSYNTNARLLSLVPSLLDTFLEAPIHSSLFNTNLKE